LDAQNNIDQADDWNHGPYSSTPVSSEMIATTFDKYVFTSILEELEKWWYCCVLIIEE